MSKVAAGGERLVHARLTRVFDLHARRPQIRRVLLEGNGRGALLLNVVGVGERGFGQRLQRAHDGVAEAWLGRH